MDPQQQIINAIASSNDMAVGEAGAIATITKIITDNPGMDLDLVVEGFTPLALAGQLHKNDIVTLLLSKGADPNANGGQALFLAAFPNQFKDIVDILTSAGATQEAMSDRIEKYERMHSKVGGKRNRKSRNHSRRKAGSRRTVRARRRRNH